jgi:hypothetical protein
MLFVGRPRRFLYLFSASVVPAPVGVKFHGYRAQSAVVPERQRSWVIGSAPSLSRGHVGPAAACTDGPATIDSESPTQPSRACSRPG